MAEPQNKPELLEANAATFEKLGAIIDSLSPEAQAKKFGFRDRDRNVRDVLVHLYGWHELLIVWVEKNLAGTPAEFMPGEHSFDDFEPLNEEIRDEHASVTLAEARTMLVDSHARVTTLVEGLSDDELFTLGHLPWTKTWTLGTLVVGCTSEHYEWAITKLRQHAKTA